MADFIIGKPNVTNDDHPIDVSQPNGDFYYGFDIPAWRQWMSHYRWLGIVIAFVYIGAIFGLQRLMKYRRPLKLRRALILWNVGLTLTSAVFVYNCVFELGHVLMTHGFNDSVCNRSILTTSFKFWALLGTWSKLLELGDTFFIVLRKRPLILLHWYHHAIMVALTFWRYSSWDPMGLWYITVNKSVHTLMYAYYTLQAAEFNVPRKLALALTATQILQFAIGLPHLNMYTGYRIYQGHKCDRSMWFTLSVELPVGFSFLILFVRYFLTTYIYKDRQRRLKRA